MNRRGTGTWIQSLDELDRGEVAFDDLAEGDEDQLALLVDDRVEGEHVAEHADDLELFLVQRIAGEIARHGRRVLHEGGGVERPDRIGVGNAGRDDLAPAGVAGHEVRLDQAGGDPHLRLDEAPVELHRHAAPRGPPEIDMGGIVAREMVFDPHGGEHPGIADQRLELGALVRTMQPGRDEDRDRGRRNPRRHQPLDQRAQEQPVRHRPGDVADEDAGAALAAGVVDERRRTGRLRQHIRDRPRRLGDRRARLFADDHLGTARRHLRRDPALAVEKLDRHGTSRRTAAGATIQSPTRKRAKPIDVGDLLVE